MPRVLVVADEPWIRNEVLAALSAPGYELIHEDDPRLAAARAEEEEPDAAVVDLQVGSMGGMAITRSLKALAADNDEAVPVVLLLDRSADAFLAKRAGAGAWVRKPFTAFELRGAIESVTSVESA